MRKIVIALALTLSGCSGTAMYQPADGGIAFETTEQMATIMANRDMVVAHKKAVQSAFEHADSPEDAVGAAVLGVQEVGQLQRPRSLDERLLPWAQLLAPYVANFFANPNMTGDGAVIDGDNNTFYMMKDVAMTESQNYVQMSPAVTQSYHTQIDTDESANDGSYAPVTDTQP